MANINKIKLWFVCKKVVGDDRLSKITKDIIKLINKLEVIYNKKMFDLRAIEYSRFLLEKKIKISTKDLPAVLINNKIVFRRKLPTIDKLKIEIKKYLK